MLNPYVDHHFGPLVIRRNDRQPYLYDVNDYTARRKTESIVIHCSDTPPSMDIGAEDIRPWHVEGREWMDIGYHFVIRRDGTIELGRPTGSVGAGVEGHNSNSLHICLVGGKKAGGGEVPEDNFTKIQKANLAILIIVLQEFYGLKGQNAEVLGHRDFPGVKKACPSFDAREWWASLDPEAKILTVHDTWVSAILQALR